MRPHWHASVDQLLLYGLSAIVVINLGRLAAVQLVKVQQPLVRSVGEGIAALVR